MRGVASGIGRLATLVAALALSACATQPRTVPQPARLAVNDYTDDFARAFAAAGGDPASRLPAIRAALAPSLPGFYDPARFGARADSYSKLAGSFLATYPSRRAAIAEVAQRFGAMFDPAVADFEARVGPLPTDVPVDLVIARGEFDGATRQLGDGPHLMFGADMISLLHPGGARAFVQHELFHLYHAKRMESCTGLYCSVWREGLAVHAARVLNPAATDAELLLTVPQPIRPALEANRQEAVCLTLARLDSTAPADRTAWTSNGRVSERLPPRFGYLVGAWIAEDLGRTRSLSQLAALGGADLRAAMEESLRGMAPCA